MLEISDEKYWKICDRGKYELGPTNLRNKAIPHEETLFVQGVRNLYLAGLLLVGGK